MKVVFLGTPEFAVPTLNALCASHEVVAVITQPDRPQGRGNKLAPPPVKVAALSYDIPVYQFEKLNCQEAKDLLARINPDVAVVVAYGQLLKPWLLELPRFGCINIHGSLLPRWRGAAPIHWSIVKGDKETGVTIMQMDVGLDTGPMYLKKAVPIRPCDTYHTMHDKLKMEGALALIEVLDGLEQGLITPQAQDDTLSCYAPLIARDMAAIDWTMSAQAIVDQIRGFDHWPAAFTLLEGERIKCFEPSVVELESSGPGVLVGAGSLVGAGILVGVRGDRLVVCAGDGLGVAIGAVQAPSSKRMSVKAFLAGRPLAPGTKFDSFVGSEDLSRGV